MTAYDILSQLPHGKRSTYIIDAIIEKNDAPPLKSTMLYIKDSIEKKIDILSESILKGNIKINAVDQRESNYSEQRINIKRGHGFS